MRITSESQRKRSERLVKKPKIKPGRNAAGREGARLQGQELRAPRPGHREAGPFRGLSVREPRPRSDGRESADADPGRRRRQARAPQDRAGGGGEGVTTPAAGGFEEWPGTRGFYDNPAAGDMG